MTTLNVKRRCNGTIDIDFYRAQGLMERKAVMTKVFRALGRSLRPAAAIIILIGMVWSMPPREPTPDASAFTALAHGKLRAAN